jgi:hypothetical protein
MWPPGLTPRLIYLCPWVQPLGLAVGLGVSVDLAVVKRVTHAKEVWAMRPRVPTPMQRWGASCPRHVWLTLAQVAGPSR